MRKQIVFAAVALFCFGAMAQGVQIGGFDFGDPVSLFSWTEDGTDLDALNDDEEAGALGMDASQDNPWLLFGDGSLIASFNMEWNDNTGADAAYTVSTDGGATWDDPVKMWLQSVQTDDNPDLNANGGTDTGSWESVRYDYANGTFVVIMRAPYDHATGQSSLDEFNNNDVDLPLVGRSTDGGATWTDWASLRAPGVSYDDDLDQLTVSTDGSGNWLAIWNDSNDHDGDATGEEDVLMAMSTDDGATWSDPALLAPSASDPDFDADEGDNQEGDPNVAWGGDTVIVVFETNTDHEGAGSDQDVAIVRSTDDGATWEEVAFVNPHFDTDDAADNDPHIATDGSGAWVIVYESTYNIPGVDNVNADGGDDGDLFCQYSTDDGVTWSEVVLPESYGATDFDGNDPNWGGGSQLYFDPRGTGAFICAWHQGDHETVGGTIEEDTILLSYSLDGGQTWTTTMPFDWILDPTYRDNDMVEPRITATADGTALLWADQNDNLPGLGAGFDGDNDPMIAFTDFKFGGDTDNDGMSDVAEGTDDPDGDGTPNYKDEDSDGDGLDDAAEDAEGTDRYDSDTDNDGLSDGDEVTTYFTDPTDRDSDDDGVNDGAEISAGTDPNDPNDFPPAPLSALPVAGALLLAGGIAAARIRKRR